MQPRTLSALAIACLALALLLAGVVLWQRHVAERRGMRVLADALERRDQQSRQPPAPDPASAAAPDSTSRANPASTGARALGGLAGTGDGARLAGAGLRASRLRWLQQLITNASRAGMQWIDTPFGRQIVAQEDRRMLEQCGFVDARARALFLIARIGGASLLPPVVLVLAGWRAPAHHGSAIACVALLAGFMLPKLVLRRRASARRLAVVDELPMFVDMLRLLQGVGLSLDQCLQVMVNDFRGVLPVLSDELAIAQRQASAGRTREQSLQRLACVYANEDLRVIVRLLIQVDRHGGAVQEPLRQFGDRLREARRSMLRERIGQLTVKMTGVMVVTLLPALLIVSAGPGVLAVVHSLSVAAATHR